LGNNRPIKIKDWVKFLEAHNCKKKRHNKTSHEHWKCPNCFRTITFRSQYKEIPAMHLKTNLTTMGYDLQYLYKWLENN
jgi:ribosomal protein L37AE/L43A